MPRPFRFFAVWILAVALLALHAAHFHHVVDDAYISFRYLRHALAGHGLVFNPGERVEGYTNFLWILMLAPGAALGAPLPRMAAALGVLCMGTAVALRWRLAHEEIAVASPGQGRSGASVLATVLILCACGPVAYWAAGGLETGLFCLLVLLLAGLVWHGRSLRDAVAAGLAAALLCMARPDGVVYLVAAVGWLCIPGRPGSTRADRARACLGMLLTFVLVYGPYFVWRWRYYDAPLPNTFYAKVGGGSAAVLRGLQYVLGFLLFSGIGAVLLAAGVGTVLRRRRPPATTTPALAALIAAFAAAGTLFVLAVGGDQLAMFRFMVPVLILLVPSLWLASTRGLPGPGLRGVLTTLTLGVVAVPSFAGPMVGRVTRSERPADADRAAIGRWLRTSQAPDTLVAVVPAGILPYESGLPTLDLLGLNDRHIARAAVPDLGRGMPGHERYDAAYVVGRAPDLVFLGACRLWDRPFGAAELTGYVRQYAHVVPAVGAVLDHPEFQARYVPQAVPIADKFAHVWVRRRGGSPP